MTSREKILARAKENKPELLELPIIDSEIFTDHRNLLEEFTKKVEVVGGNVVPIDNTKSIIEQVSTMFPNTKTNYSTLKNSQKFNTLSLNDLNTPHELNDLDVLILNSNIAVAENGAVWLSDEKLPIRVLPFITKHLVVVIEQKNIVPFLHQAYQQLSTTDTGFGAFLSGPSKTADIEQSLVIGAHGAMTLTILLK